MASNNVILGILAIILGILVIAFPLLSIFTGSILLGIAIIFAGIWLLAQGFKVWGASKWAAIGYIILGIIAILGGFNLFGSILAVSFLASFWLYFVGFFLIISGIMSFFVKDDTMGKGAGGLGVLLGILTLIIAAYAWNPFYLAYILGIWLIIDGITLFFVKPEEVAAAE